MSYYPPPQQPPDGDQSGSGWPQQQPTYSPSPQPGQQQNTGYPQWQQPQQYPQQPYYPPQQYPPPFPPPEKKSRKTLWIVLGVIAAVVLFSCIGFSIMASQTAQRQQTNTQQPVATQSVQQPTQAAVTPTPTHTLKWVTTQTFSGNGIKETGYFTVPNNWKLVWSCNPSSFYGGQYNVIVSVYSSDGSLIDLAVNTLCKSGNTGDSTQEHQGGQIYLDVNSEGSWTIQVQELK